MNAVRDTKQRCNAPARNANDLENFDLQQCCLFVFSPPPQKQQTKNKKKQKFESTFIELLIRIAETRPELATREPVPFDALFRKSGR